MLVAAAPGDLEADWPGDDRRDLLRGETADSGKPGVAAWLTAGLSHGVLALAAVLLAVQTTPPPRELEEPQALIVEIIVEAPTPAPEPAVPEDEAVPQAEAPAPAEPEAAPEAATPEQFQVTLPDRVWPDVLRQYQEAQQADEAAAVMPGVPSGVRAALRSAFYCRAGATGIAADRRRCGHLLDDAELNARLAAFAPNHFLNPAFAPQDSVPRGRTGATTGRGRAAGSLPSPLAGGDARLSNSGDMRDRLPPSMPDPAFGD